MYVYKTTKIEKEELQVMKLDMKFLSFTKVLVSETSVNAMVWSKETQENLQHFIQLSN